MKKILREKINESFSAVMPITAIVLVISVIFVPIDVGNMFMFLVGALLLVVGMGLFQLGAETAMTPLGEGVGATMSKSRKLILVLLIGFLMGLIITIAEPDLQVLAQQVPSIPNKVIIWTVAVGVGIFLALAILRVLFKIKLSLLLWILYGMLFAVSIFTPSDFLAVAFDSGGVTTGPMTVPFIMAMGVGLASVRSDRDASSDSFGFVAISSVGPILAVMILGMFYNPGETEYSSVVIASVSTTQDVIFEFLRSIPHYMYEVLVSLAPIFAVFLIFQLITRRYHKRQATRIVVGIIYTLVGLVLFLTGVNVGFAPVGSLIGSELGASWYRWLLIPIGMLIGYFIVMAEPAVQVLNRQVEDVTQGSISQVTMNRCLSIGVSVSVGLAMLRVLTGISIYWLIIPGYAIALILTRFVPQLFVGIAFDSGGVASGPMTTTFLLPFAIGACEAIGGNVMTDAFGVVAMVAMTPLIAVQLMGLVYARRLKKAPAEELAEAIPDTGLIAVLADMEDIILEFDDEGEIIEFMEESGDE